MIDPSGDSGQQVTGVTADTVIQIQDVAGDVSVLMNRPPYRLEGLADGPAGLTVDQARAQPSRMLLARYEIVPFAGRSGFLQRLSDWLQAADPVSVRLVHGPGGQGKSRLAVHFARECALGWTTFQARRGPVPLQGRNRPTIPEAATGVLVIVDYADRWAASHLQTLIVDLCAQIGRLPGGCPLRFLLLARAAGFWWSSLGNWLETEYDIPADAMDLPPLGEDIDREELFTVACESFAAGMGATRAVQVSPPAELSRVAFGLVLTVHMAALVAIDARRHGVNPPHDPERISDYLLRRERAYWHDLHVRAEDPMVTPAQVMGRAVYVATLGGPLVRSQGVEVLGQAEITTQAEAANQILDDHRECYPPEDTGTVLEPLYPDRLGEDFLALTTPGHNLGGTDDWATTAIVRLLAPVSGAAMQQQFPIYVSQAMAVLVETAYRWPHIARDHLYPLVRRSPGLAVASGSVTLSRLISLPDIDLDVLVEIDAYLTDPGGELDVELYAIAAELAERVFRSRLDQVTDWRTRAAVHINFGRKLGYVGQYERARDETITAVDIFRESGVSGADLALALTQLAWLLLELHELESARTIAEEAIAVWQELPGSETDWPKDVAESFNVLGAAISNIGDDERARRAYERALQLRERYHETLPDERKRQDPLIAATLLNIGITFMKSAQWSEVKNFMERSVQAYRTAIEAGHRGGGRIGLMRALANVATAQWELGGLTESIKNSRESAERALTLSRSNPAAYSEEFGQFLRRLRFRLSSIGQIDDALSLTEEAIEFFQRAANEPRTAAIANLWLGFFLATLDRREEALTAFDRAILLDPHSSDLHFNKGSMLFELGRFDEAIPWLMEATRLEPDDMLGPQLLLGAITWPIDSEKAREHFVAAVASPGVGFGSITRALYRAIAMSGLGRTADAKRELEAVLSARPADEVDRDGITGILRRLQNPPLPGLETLQRFLYTAVPSREEKDRPL